MEATKPSVFGANVFNDAVMRERLPKATYKALKRTIDEGMNLEPAIAEVVATVMKDWATEKGATHFTHWFQPMTGITAEKHEAFISPTEDGRAILEFSGKELVKGEPDASSFPSGGLRATFEARGYTAWDCTSPAFVKGYTLYIPTAFCSYTGEALDLKTPLLRSMESINRQALRVLRLFGDTATKSVKPTMGPEQEYFLVDEALYNKRPDLIFTGRTLFGAKPPKGQELEDHYFGILKERVSNYMHELDEALWALGVTARTKHNEVAPAQHELAPVYTTANIATDHNHLTMEMMKKIAPNHGLTCLLHEKPFAGVNGSGKHNNWSLATDGGKNLLNPGKTPEANAQFLVFLVAVIEAVDKYADLLRLSIASAGNDHRLGANEAPPAIVSIYLGEELQAVLDQIENGIARSNGNATHLRIGVSTLPALPLDTSDRNRTSPFAFTGAKFEFRMVGSSASIAMPNIVLNTIVADILAPIADRLEKATDFEAEVNALVKEKITAHKRVIFNGNNYTQEWEDEAAKRGLPNVKSTVECIPNMIAEKNIAVLERQGVLTRPETESRYEIMLENYIKTINIEALAMLEMAKRYIQPAAFKAVKEAAATLGALNSVNADPAAAKAALDEVNGLCASFAAKTADLAKALDATDAAHGDSLAHARTFQNGVVPAMQALREVGDSLETIVDASIWPFPTYADLLFKI